MIQVQLPAQMWCQEKDCKSSQAVALFLTPAGTLSFRPVSDTWQVLMRADGNGAIVCRCPLHKAPENLVKPISIIPDSRGAH